MNPFEAGAKVASFLKAALECSIYLAPTDPGLTYNELVEVGKRADLQMGEIADAIDQVADIYIGRPDDRLKLRSQDAVMLMLFTGEEEPEYRNSQAFDFVFNQMNAIIRSEGAQNAKIERRVIVERAAIIGLPRHDVEAAITIMLLQEILREKDNVIGFAPGREHFAPPGAQMQQIRQRQFGRPIRRNDACARAYPIVKDVIARRHDGRPRHAEPLDAFADELDRLGYSKFRLWWAQMVAEFRQSSPQTSPVTATVLAAALVEGVLTFVVKHARALNLGVMGSKTFEGNPTSWRIDDLVASAAAGKDAAILDTITRQRAETLIRSRQRIHAGRMLSDFPDGPPDLRPEEARDAHTTAEQVVRCILDWLQRFPNSPLV